MVYELFFGPGLTHSAERGQQCLQAASVELLGCSLREKFFQFWMAGPAAEAEFQYPGRIQLQGQPSDGAFE